MIQEESVLWAEFIVWVWPKPLEGRGLKFGRGQCDKVVCTVQSVNDIKVP